jgi:hypothetical protein
LRAGNDVPSERGIDHRHAAIIASNISHQNKQFLLHGPYVYGDGQIYSQTLGTARRSLSESGFPAGDKMKAR